MIIKPELCEEIDPKKLSKFTDNFIAQKKYDGTRALIDTREGFNVYNKHGIIYTPQFPEFEEAMKLGGVVLDGEIIYSSDGKDNRIGSQRRCATRDLWKQKELKKEYPVKFVAFDILYLDYDNIMSKPLTQRLSILEDLINNNNLKNIEYAPTFEDIEEAWKVSGSNEWEGIVIKRKASVYIPNKRCYDWIKVKHTFEEIVNVVGVTEGSGARASTFGALELEKDGRYLGNCGSGFTEEEIDNILKLVLKDKSIQIKVKHYGYTEDGKLTTAIFKEIINPKSLNT